MDSEDVDHIVFPTICKCFVSELNVAFLILSVFVPHLYSRLSGPWIIQTILSRLNESR